MDHFAQKLGGKAEAVAAELRSQIVQGHYSPGGQLSKLDDMEAQFGVTRPTLTRAIKRLKSDGFVRTTRSKGTFVTDRPPHLVRFGLAFSSHPKKSLTGLGGWNRFWDMLAEFGPEVARQMGLEMPVFYDVAGRGSEGEQHLIHDLRHRRLGGLVIVGSPELLRSLPTLEDYPVPTVAIYDGKAQLDMPKVYIDKESFFNQAINTLLSLGRRRVATIHLDDFGVDTSKPNGPTASSSLLTDRMSMLASTMRDRGFESPPYWQLRVGLPGAHNLIRLLMDLPKDQRPDGLMICDDNLTSHVVEAVHTSGRRIPDDLCVVAHANWPAPPVDTAPIIRLGFDVQHLIHTTLETLQAMRQGKEVLPVQKMLARPESRGHTLSHSVTASRSVEPTAT